MIQGYICDVDVPHNRSTLIIAPDTENERTVSVRGIYAMGEEVKINEEKEEIQVSRTYSYWDRLAFDL
jgi:hypothetical protein